MPRAKRETAERALPIPGDEDILDVAGAAAFMRYSVSYTYQLMHRKEIPYYKPRGRKAFFVKGELRAFILRGRVATGAELSALADAAIGA